MGFWCTWKDSLRRSHPVIPQSGPSGHQAAPERHSDEPLPPVPLPPEPLPPELLPPKLLPPEPLAPEAEPRMPALPNGILERILHNMFVEGSQSGLCILPLVSHSLLACLQDLSLSVGRLSGEQALSAQEPGRWTACSKRAWSLHTLSLLAVTPHSRRTGVTDVSALAGGSSLHTLDLSWTGVTDVSALAGCASLHTLVLTGTGVTDVSALVGCPSLLFCLHSMHTTH